MLPPLPTPRHGNPVSYDPHIVPRLLLHIEIPQPIPVKKG